MVLGRVDYGAIVSVAGCVGTSRQGVSGGQDAH
jgi:hypothetical protein